MKKLIVLVFVCRILNSWAAEVSTSQGKIIGSGHMKTRNGRKIYSFTGIPYARPPTGELRFKEAKPAEAWKEPFDATEEGNECSQVISIPGLKDGSRITLGDEDCLILNVFSPQIEPLTKLPVIVFIHGGGFTAGSSKVYSPEFLLDKDIVLVTFNYRLSVLGFLTSGDESMPANIGLKDQVLALKWVRDNIKNFGGDPNLVTVFGESAGAASTHLHLLSPLSKGLIHRAIAMSGTGFCHWVMTSPQIATNRTKSLAVLCGCPSEPTTKMLKCMQELPVETLLDASQKFYEWLVTPTVIFGPTVEAMDTTNAFITGDLSKVESKIPFMTGLNSGEGDCLASILFGIGGMYETELKEHPQHTLPIILELNARFAKEEVPAVSNEIQKFYFGEKPIGRQTLQEFVDMVTDSWMLIGTVEAIRKYGGDVYFLYFDYLQSDSINDFFGKMIEILSQTSGNGKIKGVAHGDDLLAIFPMSAFFPDRTMPEKDLKVSEMMVDILTNFAKYGDPTVNTSMKWEPTGKNGKTNYLHISENGFTQEENLFPERIAFWDSLCDRYYQKKVIGQNSRRKDFSGKYT